MLKHVVNIDTKAFPRLTSYPLISLAISKQRKLFAEAKTEGEII
jgi:hypothetical protein